MSMTDPGESSDSSAAEPDLSDFLAPVEPRKSRRALISVIAALTVLVMVSAAVASVLVWTSRGGSSTGDAASAAQGPGEPASQFTAAQITDATERYVAAVNAGIASDYLRTLCEPIRERLGDITDTEAADPQMVVREVTDVVVNGDIATATVSISPEGNTAAAPRADTLRFLNEGGWKYCGQFQ